MLEERVEERTLNDRGDSGWKNAPWPNAAVKYKLGNYEKNKGGGFSLLHEARTRS